jgi:hypothetical protein
MKIIYYKFAKHILFLVVFVLVQACSTHADNVIEISEVEFTLSGAPLTDDNARGVYITVSAIIIDGVSIPEFVKQTINLNLRRYEEGYTKGLVKIFLPARTYNKLTLILDTQKDDHGFFPGCYVMTTADDKKYSLGNGKALSISLNNEWTVVQNIKSTFVIEFDARKVVKRVDAPSIRYEFSSNGSLQESVRVLNQKIAGKITGNLYIESDTLESKIIVYAYKLGRFDPHTEIGLLGGQILFQNAVTIVELQKGARSWMFTLNFLEKGEYELYFAKYDIDANNLPVFKGMMNSEITSGAVYPNVVAVPTGSAAFVVVMCKS